MKEVIMLLLSSFFFRNSLRYRNGGCQSESLLNKKYIVSFLNDLPRFTTGVGRRVYQPLFMQTHNS